MKVTTSLMEIYQSELQKLGKNEMYSYDQHQIVAYDDDFVFIKKLLRYDEDIEYITDNKIFLGLTLDNPEHDREFKRLFLNRFMDRQIAFQTMESFASKVGYLFLSYKEFLNTYYNDIDKFLTGTSMTTTKGNENRTSDNRNAFSSLPQTEVNIDVDNTILDYADDNTINREKTQSESDGVSDSKNYNIDDYLKAKSILEEVLNSFDENCFLQVW